MEESSSNGSSVVVCPLWSVSCRHNELSADWSVLRRQLNAGWIRAVEAEVGGRQCAFDHPILSRWGAGG